MKDMELKERYNNCCVSYKKQYHIRLTPIPAP